MINCPRDGNKLIKYSGTTRPAWHCNVCTGAFIKTLPIHEYQSNEKMQPREEWDVEVLCPEDGEKMASLTIKGVAIDTCSKCGGIWLDGGEIETSLGSDLSRQLSSESLGSKSSGGAWSEADALSPLIDAALGALFHV